MKIKQLVAKSNAAIYTTDAFRKVIEDHLQEIRSKGTGEIKVPSARQVEKYRGDFYGLLLEWNVNKDLLWITTRVNGLYSSSDYNGDTPFVRLIIPQYIHSLYELHSTTIYSR